MNAESPLSQTKQLDAFLKNTLDGYEYLENICSGFENLNNILTRPEIYQLGHISGDKDAWFYDDRLVFQFNDGVHFVFTPITSILKHPLIFVDGKWD